MMQPTNVTELIITHTKRLTWRLSTTQHMNVVTMKYYNIETVQTRQINAVCTKCGFPYRCVL